MKSSFSNNDCVDVIHDPTTSELVVTDTKLHTPEGRGPELRFTYAEWEAFVGGVQMHEFTLERLRNLTSST